MHGIPIQPIASQGLVTKKDFPQNKQSVEQITRFDFNDFIY